MEHVCVSSLGHSIKGKWTSAWCRIEPILCSEEVGVALCVSYLGGKVTEVDGDFIKQLSIFNLNESHTRTQIIHSAPPHHIYICKSAIHSVPSHFISLIIIHHKCVWIFNWVLVWLTFVCEIIEKFHNLQNTTRPDLKFISIFIANKH